MKLVNFLFFIIFTVHITYAQRDSIISDIKVDTSFIIEVSPKLSKLVVHFSGYAVRYDKNNPYYGKIYYTVEIKKYNSGEIIQTIKSANPLRVDPLHFDYGGKDETIEKAIAIDINFDGYKDIRFCSGSGYDTYSVNQTYDYYLYNPKTDRLEYNEEISMLINPTPFLKEQIVRSYTRNAFSGTDGTIEEYKWNKNKLVLLKSYNYELNGPCKFDIDCKFTRTIKYYKNGKATKTETKIINQTEIPEQHLLYW
jgi:hypothetical protein